MYFHKMPNPKWHWQKRREELVDETNKLQKKQTTALSCPFMSFFFLSFWDFEAGGTVDRKGSRD